jgi:hypothetical protein
MNMNTHPPDHYLDLRRADIEPEMFAAALTVQHVRRLIIYGGSDNGRLDLDSTLQPQHLELFLARAVETSRRTKHFEHEWRRLQQLFPRLRNAWEKGQTLFQEDLAGAIDRPEEMEYVSTINVVDCSASAKATNLYPPDRTLQNWTINGYMLAWQQHFLADNATSQGRRS